MLGLKPRVDEQQKPAPLSPDGHMTEEEARTVVALWSERHNALEAGPTGPRVTDVADALDTTPEEAQGLLDEVRTRQARASQVQRGYRSRNSVVGVIILACAWWASVFNVAPDAPTLTVEGVQTRMLTPEQRRGMVLDIADARTDVVFKYHPHSLLRFVLGPDWNSPAPMFGKDVSLTDLETGPRTAFKAPGGGQEGVTSGWMHHVGFQTYSIGYAYPLSQMAPGPVMLHAQAAADGKILPIDVQVR